MSAITAAKRLLSPHPAAYNAAMSLYYAGAWAAGAVFRQSQVARYLKERGTRPKGLHIGCGNIRLPGWLDTDAFPRRRGVAFIDATSTPFPFPADSFDFAYSEHMIEHIPFEKGLAFLQEIGRILKPNGVIRLATPDLRRIASLLDAPPEGDARHFMDFMIEDGWGEVPFRTPCMALNHCVRAWGHRFVYDEETLVAALREAGFDRIVRCAVGESDHPFLRGLERHGEIADEAVNRFETMVLEASKRP